MLFQLEITTHCNYNCFYCAGRKMPQRHMSMACFDNILSRIAKGERHWVSLQGEGEPMVHPLFWSMVEKVRDSGYIPYTITNGSIIDCQRIKQYFPQIGISLDTINAEEAQNIGRFKLNQVLQNLKLLTNQLSPERIIIHSVDYGQDFKPLRYFLQQHGLTRHIVQPLQQKSDYRQHYERVFSAVTFEYHYRCRFIEQPTMRFFTIDGVELPCCFIKDVSKFTSTQRLQHQLQQQQVPDACSGCREITIAS
ncbi:radical SAM protein [Methylocucumis oryzae]|nr:radical SAM protein [Methylocucumis oryzae]